MKKRNKKSPSELTRILASSNERKKVLNAFFAKSSTSAIRKGPAILKMHHHFKPAITLSLDSKHRFYESLTPTLNNDLEKNIAWCLGLVDVHSKEIAYFINAEAKLEILILEQETNSALLILDEIDVMCGISTWSISLRASLLAFSGRVDEHQDLVSKYIKDDHQINFFKSVVLKLSERYSDSDMLSPEAKFFEQSVRRSFTGDILHFATYKFIKNTFNYDLDFASIFGFEKNTSIIDIFKCLLDFTLHSFISDMTDVEKSEAQKVVKHLCHKFNSAHINGLANIYGIKTNWEFEKSKFDILDYYTSGDYSGAINSIKDEESNKYNFTLFELSAKCSTRNSIAPYCDYQGKIFSSMVSLLVKNENFDKSVIWLEAQTFSFGMLPWFRELQLFLCCEAKLINGIRSKKLDQLRAALSSVNSPGKAFAIHETLESEYIEKLKISNESSLVYRLFEISRNYDKIESAFKQLSDVAPGRMKKFIAIQSFERHDYSSAVNLFSELINDNDVLIAQSAARNLADVYLAMHEYEKAAEVFVNTIIKNENLISIFDSRAICFECQDLINISKSATLPFLFSIHSRFVSDEFDPALSYSFEIYLNNNNAKLPLDLTTSKDSNTHYFLRYVCTPSAMKNYLEFSSASEIERYRVSICQYLIEQGDSIEDLSYEVKERTRKLVLRDAAKQIESSRIYADTSFMFSSSVSDIKTMYNRFSELRENDYSLAQDELTLDNMYRKFSGNKDIVNNMHLLHIQDLILNEKNGVFLKLIKRIRDEFTFGDKGLNGYLSTRIRHGHFPNAIRKCFSDNNLTIPKSSSLSNSRKQSYWSTHFESLSGPDVIAIEKLCSDFALKINQMIDEVNDKWFQIHTIDQEISGLSQITINDKAMFNFSVTSLETYSIQLSIGKGREYTEFAKVATQWLWSRTENSLKVIRERLADEFRDSICLLIDKFHTDILQVAAKDTAISEFNDAISRARTSLSATVETIASWFTRSHGVTLKSFDFDIPIEIARLSTSANVKIDISCHLQFQGVFLSYFVDFLYVIFENCVSKSGINKENLEINTSVKLDNDNFIVTIENDCKFVGDIILANAGLDIYREQYGKADYAIKAAQGEGQSGFFKVWKSLYKDMDLMHSIEFGYANNQTFRVQISVPMTELKKVIFYEDTSS
ncbi:tetratricopeptide repeat protein [Deefgea salmonis]|uniref:Tetratricopeptide repeat protein n=1 Tax=Deefgea salmonis TaxID=2875502 RepID=A0ABS8BLJ2_9NEIS|nr:hypothetical protein [Deefgea salmonis]MCB5196386.1 hypothetical protein [Deefgea salmonis]